MLLKLKKILCIILIISLSGCFSERSIQVKNFVPHAVVQVNDSLKVTGKLLDDKENLISIALDGVLKDYLKTEIKSYEIVMLPDERLMLEDINNNSRTVAQITSFSFWFTIVAVLVGAYVLYK